MSIESPERAELAEALKEVGKAAGRWRRALMVEEDQIGRYDDQVAGRAADAYQEACTRVEEIVAEC